MGRGQAADVIHAQEGAAGAAGPLAHAGEQGMQAVELHLSGEQGEQQTSSMRKKVWHMCCQAGK